MADDDAVLLYAAGRAGRRPRLPLALTLPLHNAVRDAVVVAAVAASVVVSVGDGHAGVVDLVVFGNSVAADGGEGAVAADRLRVPVPLALLDRDGRHGLCVRVSL